ncbi:MAG: hypothetical protein ACYDEX_08440 [Mobilitalea sp.]
MDYQQSSIFHNLQMTYQDELMTSTRALIDNETARYDIEIINNYTTIALHNKEHARNWLRLMN